MSFAQRYLPKYTLKDYMSWEGDWELIEGIPYALASPTFEHQRLVLKIARHIDEFLERECRNCVVGIDTDYIIDDHTVLRPDVFITCEEVKGRLLKPPKVIFEVISEGTREKDEKLKKEIYQREGVEYFVIVYPELKKARIFRLSGKRYVKVADVTEDLFTFELGEYSVPLEFSKIWRS